MLCCTEAVEFSVVAVMIGRLPGSSEVAVGTMVPPICAWPRMFSVSLRWGARELMSMPRMPVAVCLKPPLIVVVPIVPDPATKRLPALVRV